MTNQETKTEERNKRFDEMERNHGWIPEHKERVKSFLQSEVDIAVAEERKRIVKILPNNVITIQDYGQYFKKDILSLITPDTL